MPVPYHLDESDSDSIVSRKFSSDFYFLCMLVYLSECSHRSSVRKRHVKTLVMLSGSHRNGHVHYIHNLALLLFIILIAPGKKSDY